jgi:hypothetical protein
MTPAPELPLAGVLMHVLHNKREFPFVAYAGDLVVLALDECFGEDQWPPQKW